MIIVERTNVPHIYLEVWSGPVTKLDLEGSTKKAEELIELHSKDKAYVTLLDISHLASLPNDLKTLKNATKTHDIAFAHIIVFGSNNVFFNTIAKLIGGMTGYDIQVAANEAEAMSLAKNILQLANKG